MTEVGEQDLVTVCPYCRTCYTVDGAIIKDHYLVPAYYSSSEAIENLVLWVKKQIGAEEDLPLHLEVVSTTLDYYPFWHVVLQAETKFSGVGQDATYSSPADFNAYRNIHFVSKPEEGSLDRGFSLTYPASATIPKELVKYEFPTRSRKYFSEAYVKEYGGKLHNGVITQKMAEEYAQNDVKRMLGELIAKEIYQVSSREDKIDLLSIFYLHVPIWHINYKYQNRSYEAYVDASTGRVIYATYPISIEHRTIWGTAAGANVVCGFLIGGLLSTYSPIAAATTFLGFLVVWGVFAVRAFRFGRGREEAE